VAVFDSELSDRGARNLARHGARHLLSPTFSPSQEPAAGGNTNIDVESADAEVGQNESVGTGGSVAQPRPFQASSGKNERRRAVRPP
jgi:hypothetical protein